MKWFKLAAEQGNASAQYNLGVMYFNGQGGPQNDETAVKWWRLAAKQGYDSAQLFLGFMYESGRGVPQNDKTAVKWFRLAAEQGKWQCPVQSGYDVRQRTRCSTEL